MAAVDVGAARNNPAAIVDEPDDLFDYAVSADLLRDTKTNVGVSGRLANVPHGHAVKAKAEGLGIDVEIKVTRKRAPVAKLDEARLLSQAGISKLKTTAKARLKFKGKGHEYSDVARLINFYQLWLDDLYPRAKFVDGLAMIEKVGHTKRMQAMRKEWIIEGKPRDDQDDQEPAFDDQGRNHSSRDSAQLLPSKDDEWSDGAFFEQHLVPSKVLQDPSKKATIDGLFMSDVEDGNDAPPEDDLDALLAEDDAKAKSEEPLHQHRNDSSGKGDDQFEDEMEAMAGLDEMW